MSINTSQEEDPQPATLPEAINLIKFLTTTHKREISKLKETCTKQNAVIKLLKANRKKELDYLENEIYKYELNLSLRTESVARQLEEKDDIIAKQAEEIEELNIKLLQVHKVEVREVEVMTVPEITVLSVESNSDSGIAMENDDSIPKVEIEPIPAKTEVKGRKCRRLAESILRRVDFSPMKYKPSNRDQNKSKKDMRKSSLDLPSPTEPKRLIVRQLSSDRIMSDDDRSAILSDSGNSSIKFKSKKLNDSMNNHFSDDGSESTSEEAFDRVMSRSSVRRSVKANPKYKKISRSKSKLLEQAHVNIAV